MCTIKTCIDTKLDIHIAILQIRSTPLGPRLPSLINLLFNCPKRGILPIINRPPVNTNNDDEHYEELLKDKQTNNDKSHDTFRNYVPFLLGSILAVQ